MTSTPPRQSTTPQASPPSTSIASCKTASTTNTILETKSMNSSPDQAMTPADSAPQPDDESLATKEANNPRSPPKSRASTPYSHMSYAKSENHDAKGSREGSVKDESEPENEDGDGDNETNGDDDDDDDDKSDAGTDTGTQSSTSLYGQESFDTFQDKVIKLCRDIGHGEPSKIERMCGGSFNRVIGLQFPSGQKSILRIPRLGSDPPDPNDINEIMDQVSVLLHLSKYDCLKVPSVLAYDTTNDNAINEQYVLQSRLQGQALGMIYDDLPTAGKLQIATALAEVMEGMEKCVLEKPGRLIGSRSLPSASPIPPISGAGYQIVGFRENSVRDLEPVENQDLRSLLHAIFESRANRERSLNDASPKLLAMYEKFQAIAAQMETAALFRPRDDECVIWHWDLCARNILVQKVGIEEETEAAKVIKLPEDSTPCHHILQLSIDDTGKPGHKCSVEVTIDETSNLPYSHNVHATLADSKGKDYVYGLQILEPKIVPTTELPKVEAPNKTKWVITGVLDWDDALSVPLVIARPAFSWLWFDEDERSDGWNGSRDARPPRPLTPNELLIKAHFDQTMSSRCPNYLEDTYGRGIWLRALARFAIYGLSHGSDFERYNQLVAGWEEYFEEWECKE